MSESTCTPIRTIAEMWVSWWDCQEQHPPPWQQVPGGVADGNGTIVPPDSVREIACFAMNEISNLLEQGQAKKMPARAGIKAACGRALRRLRQRMRRGGSPAPRSG